MPVGKNYHFVKIKIEFKQNTNEIKGANEFKKLKSVIKLVENSFKK